jgi:DNA-binding transcriptional ArsR family regulator
MPAAKRRKSKSAQSAAIFAALGDETRLRLVARLCANSPASITHLTVGCQISRQAVTKHLHVLARAGLVRGLRRGRESLFALETAQLAQARRYLDTISEQWDDALRRLKLFVEND